MDLEELYLKKPKEIAKLYKAGQIDLYCPTGESFSQSVIYPSEVNRTKSLGEIVDSSGSFVLVDQVNVNRDLSIRILVPVIEGRYIPPKELKIGDTHVFRCFGFPDASVENYNRTQEPKTSSR